MLKAEETMAPPKDALAAEYTKVFGTVALYWCCSISMVFLNKHLLSDTVDAPLFVTWVQCIVSLALCALFGWLAQMFPQYIKFPEFKLDQKLSREVLPLSFVFVGMITFNNLCLKYVGVAFYFVGRSLTTVFNVICTYIILGEKTVRMALFWCAVIIGGFMFGVDQEDASGSLSVIGVIFGVLASLCVALNAIYTKKTLPCVADNIWRLTLYNNLNAIFVFVPFMVLNGDVVAVIRYEALFSLKFWILLSLSGVLGFGMGYVTGLQIQVTSPLTHNISGTAKAAAQTVLAVIYYGDVKTLFWWLSNLIVLVGSAGYTYTKQQLMKRAHEQRNNGPAGSTASNIMNKKGSDAQQPLMRTKTSDTDEQDDVETV